MVVYNIEAHPESPNVSPYRGAVWEFQYSIYHQARNYTARVSNAKHLRSLDPITVVVDDLVGYGNSNNPVWCTYGPAANSVHVIRQDGVVALGLDWFDESQVEEAIQNL